MNIAGLWAHGPYVSSVVMTQDGNDLLANWLEDMATWQIARGTINGNQVSMSFNGGSPLTATVSADGSKLDWSNGGTWHRFRVSR